eukprot:TRINITY_DN34442_c0_g1_i1.p1 TRINITY_DN34442_c0_g1~~TRINITY_DN34442_c0_g1_i1.p1  ORF type:complete len:1161 (+),score=145.31 TRINITY_DN34442_c0_g1_i1:45-3527(+)
MADEVASGARGGNRRDWSWGSAGYAGDGLGRYDPLQRFDSSGVGCVGGHFSSVGGWSTRGRSRGGSAGDDLISGSPRSPSEPSHVQRPLYDNQGSAQRQKQSPRGKLSPRPPVSPKSHFQFSPRAAVSTSIGMVAIDAYTQCSGLGGGPCRHSRSSPRFGTHASSSGTRDYDPRCDEEPLGVVPASQTRDTSPSVGVVLKRPNPLLTGGNSPNRERMGSKDRSASRQGRAGERNRTGSSPPVCGAIAQNILEPSDRALGKSRMSQPTDGGYGCSGLNMGSISPGRGSYVGEQPQVVARQLFNANGGIDGQFPLVVPVPVVDAHGGVSGRSARPSVTVYPLDSPGNQNVATSGQDNIFNRLPSHDRPNDGPVLERKRSNRSIRSSSSGNRRGHRTSAISNSSGHRFHPSYRTVTSNGGPHSARTMDSRLTNWENGSFPPSPERPMAWSNHFVGGCYGCGPLPPEHSWSDSDDNSNSATGNLEALCEKAHSLVMEIRGLWAPTTSALPSPFLSTMSLQHFAGPVAPGSPYAISGGGSGENQLREATTVAQPIGAAPLAEGGCGRRPPLPRSPTDSPTTAPSPTPAQLPSTRLILSSSVESAGASASAPAEEASLAIAAATTAEVGTVPVEVGCDNEMVLELRHRVEILQTEVERLVAAAAVAETPAPPPHPPATPQPLAPPRMSLTATEVAMLRRQLDEMHAQLKLTRVDIHEAKGQLSEISQRVVHAPVTPPALPQSTLMVASPSPLRTPVSASTPVGPVSTLPASFVGSSTPLVPRCTGSSTVPPPSSPYAGQFSSASSSAVPGETSPQLAARAVSSVTAVIPSTTPRKARVLATSSGVKAGSTGGRTSALSLTVSSTPLSPNRAGPLVSKASSLATPSSPPRFVRLQSAVTSGTAGASSSVCGAFPVGTTSSQATSAVSSPPCKTRVVHASPSAVGPARPLSPQRCGMQGAFGVRAASPGRTATPIRSAASSVTVLPTAQVSPVMVPQGPLTPGQVTRGSLQSTDSACCGDEGATLMCTSGSFVATIMQASDPLTCSRLASATMSGQNSPPRCSMLSTAPSTRSHGSNYSVVVSAACSGATTPQMSRGPQGSPIQTYRSILPRLTPNSPPVEPAQIHMHQHQTQPSAYQTSQCGSFVAPAQRVLATPATEMYAAQGRYR